MINRTILIIVSIVAVLSLILNVYFLFGKGIQVSINQDQRQDQRQYQYQFQGQLMMNFLMAQGNQVKWMSEEFTSVSWDNVSRVSANILNTLAPYESYFSQVLIRPRHGTSFVDIVVLYPEFTTVKEKNDGNPIR